MFVWNTTTIRNADRAMLKLYCLFFLLAVKQAVSSEVRSKNNPLELKLIAKLMKENPGLAEIDPTFFQDKCNGEFCGSESIISKNIFALLIDQLTKMSNFPTLVATNISKKCHTDSQAYYDAKLLLATWASQMFESTGQLFVSNNVRTNGLFDQCINVQAEWTNTSFAGKYCKVFLDSELVLPNELVDEKNEQMKVPTRNSETTLFDNLDWLFDGPALKQPKVRNADTKSIYLTNVDFCIPSSCSMEDFRNAVAQLIGSRAIESTTLEGNRSFISMVAITEEKYCYTKEKTNATPHFNGADIIMISAFSLLGTLVFLATLHEFWKIYSNQPVKTDKDGFCLTALHCFSMITNGKYLLSTKSVAVGNFACLNGIRVLSTLWIIQFHSYLFISFGYFPMYNKFMFYQDALTWQVHGILNSTVAVDNFFFMSGLLVACSLLRELDQNKGRFNIGVFYLHRYLRLTPVYAFILSFIATLLIYTGSGPYWQTMDDWITACQWNWWNNLLYINNYVFTYPNQCMGETWYLACDMQMFIFSPLFIYLLWKWWKVGVAFAVFTVVASITGAIFVYIIWDLPAMGFFTRDITNRRMFYDFYIQSWARCPPYILGILLGWVLHCTKKNSIKIDKYFLVTGWIFAIIISLAVSYGMVSNLDPVKVPRINDFSRVSYGTLHRLAWSVSLAWIIYSCIHGYGGFINQFLSWKLFTPLSRLTYVVYLTHQNYIQVWHAFSRKPYYYTGFTHTEHFFGTVMVSFLMAFIICLVVEVPFLNLAKLLLPTRTRKTPECYKENQPNIDTEL